MQTFSDNIFQKRASPRPIGFLAREVILDFWNRISEQGNSSISDMCLFFKYVSSALPIIGYSDLWRNKIKIFLGMMQPRLVSLCLHKLSINFRGHQLHSIQAKNFLGKE